MTGIDILAIYLTDEEVLKYVDNAPLDEVMSLLHETDWMYPYQLLTDSFQWTHTREGFEYWYTIALRMREGIEVTDPIKPIRSLKPHRV